MVRAMQADSGAKKPSKGTLIKLAGLLLVGGVAGLAVLRGMDVRGLIEQCLQLVREAGPVVFFSGMAILPAVGFPLSPFTLSAGSVFAPTLGWPVVLVATWLALTVNVTITYVVSRWLARPWLEKLVVHFGYRWPEVRPTEYWSVTWLVRLTPGPPFVMQSALLGLARVPMRIYLIGSVLVAGLYGTAFAVFGEALIAGKGRMVLVGFGALMALTLGTQMIRRHLARKKKLAAVAIDPSAEEQETAPTTS
jgi:uncharacterized membrane protein YdjX (TVP38/TMEM64 family)